MGLYQARPLHLLGWFGKKCRLLDYATKLQSSKHYGTDTKTDTDQRNRIESSVINPLLYG